MSGTLYPILMRLSDRGLLESKWQPSPEGRPLRHLYRLTAEGARFAREEVARGAAQQRQANPVGKSAFRVITS
jgi:DNA-binding PadR family transcriptional regulator